MRRPNPFLLCLLLPIVLLSCDQSPSPEVETDALSSYARMLERAMDPASGTNFVDSDFSSKKEMRKELRNIMRIQSGNAPVRDNAPQKTIYDLIRGYSGGIVVSGKPPEDRTVIFFVRLKFYDDVSIDQVDYWIKYYIGMFGGDRKQVPHPNPGQHVDVGKAKQGWTGPAVDCSHNSKAKVEGDTGDGNYKTEWVRDVSAEGEC